MSKNYYEALSKAPKYQRYIVHGIIFMMVFYVFMSVYGDHKIATYKAKNKENIMSGCLYYSGRIDTKHGYREYGILNGNRILLENLRGGYPIGNNSKDLRRKLRENYYKCAKIEYVTVFTLFGKRTFIYSYITN